MDQVSDTSSLQERRQYNQAKREFQNKVDDIVQESIDLQFKIEEVPLEKQDYPYRMA